MEKQNNIIHIRVAARRFGLPRHWLLEKAKSGEIPALVADNQVLFDAAILESWLTEQAKGGGMNDKFYKLSKDLTARKDLKASDKIVYAVIVDHIGKNETGWPGKRRLSDKTGLSGQTVIDSIKRLETAGILKVNRQGNGKVNHYKSGQEIRPV